MSVTSIVVVFLVIVFCGLMWHDDLAKPNVVGRREYPSGNQPNKGIKEDRGPQ